jgi:hypothetical protein
MRYLIDGYNLLHAWGLAPRSGRPGQLQQARLNLLNRLRQWLGPSVGGVTVVFDSAHATPEAAAEKDYHGIRICFAVEGTADDCIEDLIRHELAPQGLTVVSDDHRLRLAAEHRHCRAQRCLDYVVELQTRRRPTPATAVPEPPTKPGVPSAEETRRWLEEFGELENDLE